MKPVVLDTNLIVRLVVQDDDTQFKIAKKIITSADSVILLDTVLMETAWVLEVAYNVPKKEAAQALLDFIAGGIVLETAATAAALVWYREGMDLGDAVHLVRAEMQADKFITFDAAFVRKAKGKTRCTVTKAD
jgi:predicted nucleic-acid-binding protein